MKLLQRDQGNKMQGKGGKGNKKVANSQTIVKHAIQRSSDEHTRAKFMDFWFTIAMQEGE